jgi:tRNA A37 methylthiotransferase MiaB
MRAGKRPGQALGYSQWMQPVHVDGAAGRIGSMVDVTLTAATRTSLAGELAAETAHADART